MALNTYTFTQLAVWSESTTVEANSEEEAREMLDAGNCEWDLNDYEREVDRSLELTHIEYGCPLAQMVVNEQARKEWEARHKEVDVTV